MRIDAIDLFHVRMPLLSPWRTAYGEDAAVESILVRMRAGGHVAWSETSPLAAPCYSPEWASGVFMLLRDWLAPAVVGHDIESGEALAGLLRHFKGNPFAKGALDIAWWTLAATAAGVPLHRFLGATRDVVPVGADFGVLDSIDELLSQIAAAVAAGFPRIKLKFRPGWDVPMLAAVRREFPTAVIHIDCNSGYRLADAELFRRLDDFNLAMIEQPLAHDDLIDHAALQRMIKTPICLDESITSVDQARQAIELGSCRYVNIKPARVGGLTAAVEIHNLCRDAGVPCWVGGMLESAVGARACIALAMLDNFSYPADIFPSTRFYRRDLSTPPVELVMGAGHSSHPGPVRRPGPTGVPSVAALDAPGTGAVPDEEMLANGLIGRATVMGQ